MMSQPRLALNAAAWFFVGRSDEVGTDKSVPISTPFRIGREPGTDLCLPCSSVSGLHAEIVELDGELWLRDLKSTNGTFVNGVRIAAQTKLCVDDTVQFGTSVFHIGRDQDEESRDPFNSGSASGLTPKLETAKSLSANERFERLLAGGVVPFFQPILQIDNSKSAVVGYEVLGRSRLFGLHTPAQMFAAASKLEMEAELSRELRKQGICTADKNLPAGQLLFVNTHPAELQCRGLEESLFAIRDNHPRRPIIIEIHESVLNDAENFAKLHRTLKNLDIQLALHDFGSSPIRLAELGELRPDIVKFDVKLTQGIDTANARRQKFVSSLVTMMRELGIRPMAECIEQLKEHETIGQLGFEWGQGFHYGRPSAIEDCPQNAESTKNVPQVSAYLDADIPAAKTKDAAWLLEQPGHHYSIQVMSAISLARAQEHVAQQANPEQFAIFSKQGKTRPLFIVVWGVYSDRSSAKTAASQLTNASVSPWIRLLSSIHAEIESSDSRS